MIRNVMLVTLVAIVIGGCEISIKPMDTTTAQLSSKCWSKTIGFDEFKYPYFNAATKLGPLLLFPAEELARFGVYVDEADDSPTPPRPSMSSMWESLVNSASPPPLPRLVSFCVPRDASIIGPANVQRLDKQEMDTSEQAAGGVAYPDLLFVGIDGSRERVVAAFESTSGYSVNKQVKIQMKIPQ